MPRIGQNPMRWVKEVHTAARVTVTTIVYIPHLDGYFAESLDVLKLCLDSLRDNTETPFDLFVFDNGSCPEVQAYLQQQYQEGRIEYLLLSQHNIGKVGAWNFLLSAAPGEYIAYTDSDVYFRPKWLEESLEIFKAFPKTGVVTAQPARRGLPRYCKATLDGIKTEDEIQIEQGDLIPAEYIEACAYGLGRTLSEHQQIIAGQEDIKIKKGAVEAFVSADHFQFVAAKKALREIFPLNVSMPLGPTDDYQLDSRMDEMGYWRLSTTEYLAHHLGNHLPQTPDERQVIFGGNMELVNAVTKAEPKAQAGRWLKENRFARRLLKQINAWTYKILYE